MEEIQEGIRHGVRKVNIDTDLRLAATAATREFLTNSPREFDPRKYLGKQLQAMKEVIKDRLTAFGTAGQAANIRPLSLEKFSTLYASGDLAPIVH